jgi:hypothetical protein
MNKLIKTKVADIMLRHPETQDNDRELIVRYWQDEISELRDIDPSEAASSRAISTI